MKPTGVGYVPDGGLAATLATILPAAGKDGMPAWDLVEYERPIDSAEAQPADWHTIAADIAARYADYDGFVVIHGTDTMAYTASALSFALQGVRKPVIVTGSQIPLCEVRNDARNNLTSALWIAARYSVPEVGLFFHDRLLRGNRATKLDSAAFAAFDSPNHPVLARVGINIELNAAAVLPMPGAEQFQVIKPGTQEVAVLRLYPGLTSARLQHMLAPPLAGLVLQSYGAGNGPVAMPGFLDALDAASARGTVIVNLTQCQRGGVDQTKYATGSALADAGVVGGGDLTLEAAVAKLHYLLSCGLEPDAVRRQMPLPLCGECSQPA